uniref:Uncharacterized protein n=1 Tax=Anguilla anguilla TaxID=7936 RepID=A0A0E9RIM0_ANGAN
MATNINIVLAQSHYYVTQTNAKLAARRV